MLYLANKLFDIQSRTWILNLDLFLERIVEERRVLGDMAQSPT